MEKSTYTILVLVVLLVFSSCKRDKWPCIKGKGSTSTENRMISGFSGINFQTEGTVYISYGVDYSVKIEAQQNIIDDMVTDLRGGELEIYNHHCLNSHEPIKIYVTMPQLESIDLSGSGNIVVQSKFSTNNLDATVSGSGDIQFADSSIANTIGAKISGSGSITMKPNCNSFTGKISGSGNITLNGTAVSEYLTVSGSGDFHAFGLPVINANVTISGSGNAEVTVSGSLDVTISGSGNVYYKGSPSVNTHISGSGNLIHL